MSSNSASSFKYTTADSVKIRLVNKVQFQSKPDSYEEGEMPNQLLCQLIEDAEADVEMQLRGRYAIPLRSKNTNRFADLPSHTRRVIRKVVDLKAVMLILETDFGRGTHVQAEGYVDTNAVNYKKEITLLLGKDMIGAGPEHERFKISPPLEDLLLASHNREADDGYRGRIINTDAAPNASDYASEQINNPSQAYTSRRFNNPAGG